MSETFAYPASVVRDEAGFYLVTFPDFPEAATDGESREAALEEASDALEEAIAGRMNRGDDIPHPSARKARQARVPVPAQMAVKAALYIAVNWQSASTRMKKRSVGSSIRITVPNYRAWKRRWTPWVKSW